MLGMGGLIKFIAVLTGVLAVWLSADSIKQKAAEVMPVRYVRVEGEFSQISKQSIQDNVLPLLRSGFLATDIQVMHATVTAFPWVRKALVKRVWPDAFNIRIHEHHAIARWASIGLLNKQGELFSPKNAAEFTSLAVIDAVGGEQKKMLKQMQTFNQGLLQHSLMLQKLIISDRQSWRVILMDGMEIKLGRNQPHKNFQRLLSVLPVLGAEKVAAIAAVDMRYPNGFSVAWKAGTKIDWNNEIKQRIHQRKT